MEQVNIDKEVENIENEFLGEPVSDVVISKDAQDLEGDFFAQDNVHSGNLDDDAYVDDQEIEDKSKQDSKVEKTELKEEKQNKQDVKQKANPDDVARIKSIRNTGLSEEDAMNAMLEQPFTVVMENFQVPPKKFIDAADQLFQKGFFSTTIIISGLEIKLRSKNMNDHVDFADYMRRILITQISQREFETLRQLRQLAYAIVGWGSEDLQNWDADRKFKFLLGKDELALTMIINASREFWRISHLLMHPGAISFLESQPRK